MSWLGAFASLREIFFQSCYQRGLNGATYQAKPHAKLQGRKGKIEMKTVWVLMSWPGAFALLREIFFQSCYQRGLNGAIYQAKPHAKLQRREGKIEMKTVWVLMSWPGAFASLREILFFPRAAINGV